MEIPQLDTVGGILLPPQQPELRVMSVNDACDELFLCNEPSQAASWLQVLHHTILRERLDTYVPSEAFLCLQEVVNRFKAQHEESSRSETTTSRVDRVPEENGEWMVIEESMWAAAALARVCVGPAWRLQLQRRRSWLSGRHGFQPHVNEIMEDASSTLAQDGETTTPPEVVTHDTSPRSDSPMTASSLGNISVSRSGIWYPPIPEVLPAAMLRFAASAIQTAGLLQDARDLGRRKHLAEAQRELVLALCCSTSEEPEEVFLEVKREDWSIVGAHEPVASMVLFWLQIATLGWSPSVQNFVSDEQTILTDRSSSTTKGSGSGVGSSLGSSRGKQGKSVDVVEKTPNFHSQNETSVSEQAGETTPATRAEGNLINDGVQESEGEPQQSWRSDSNKEMEDSPLKPLASQRDSTGAVEMKQPHESVCQTDSRSSQSHTALSDSGLQTVDIDWWYTLQVARAATDLVSSGWCPPPRGNIGAHVVMQLLLIAEKGTLLRPSDLKCEPSSTDREAREERLAAASSAAEAVSALVSLGSCGLIPKRMQAHTVGVLCRIQVTATMSFPSISAIYPLGGQPDPGEQEEWEMERDTFVAQRESCFADTIDLLRVLLNHDASVMTTVKELIRLSDVHLSKASTGDALDNDASLALSMPKPNLEDHQSRNLALFTVAIDCLTTSFWGDRSGITGLPTLRVFWLPVLDLLCMGGSSVYTYTSLKLRPRTSRSQSSLKEGVSESRFFSSASPQQPLSAALEIIVALRKLAHTELVHGDGLLTPCEWDAFVLALDHSVLPWVEFAASVDDNDFPARMDTAAAKTLNQLFSEANGLLLQMAEFLDRCFALEDAPYHLIVDAACGRKLYLMMLRKAVPYMEKEKATRIALAVFRCWAAVGFMPWGGTDWYRVASDILAYALSVYDGKHGRCGGYVHSARVRLETLNLITTDEGEHKFDPLGAGFSDNASLGSRGEQAVHSISPLSLTKNLPEQYSELVRVSVLPAIVSILGFDSVEFYHDIERLPVVAIPPKTRTSRHEGNYGGKQLTGSPHVEDGDKELRLYAIQLLGKLYRCAACETQHRILIVQILSSTALNEDSSSVTQGRSVTKPEAPSAGAEIGHSADEFPHQFFYALEAIRQLDLCLCATFYPLPHAHQCLPLVIDALFSTVKCYGGQLYFGGTSKKNACPPSKGMLTLAALLPLCRLSVSHHRHLCLLKNHVTNRHIREVLQQVYRHDADTYYDEFEYPEDVVDEPMIAPFVTVSSSNKKNMFETRDSFSASTIGQTSEKTVVALEPLVDVIVFLLKSSAGLDVASDNMCADLADDTGIQELTSRLRSICYDKLSNLILTGVSVKLPADVVAAVASPSGSRGPPFASKEKASRLRAITTIAEYVHSFCDRLSESNLKFTDVEAACDPLETLLQLCQSEDSTDTAAGCHGLSAVLAELNYEQLVSNDDKATITTICNAVIKRLRSLLDAEDPSQTHNDVAPGMESDTVTPVALLTILYSIFSNSENQAVTPEPEPKRQTYILAYEIYSSSSPTLCRLSRLLALRCVAAAISRMEENELTAAFCALCDKSGESKDVTQELWHRDDCSSSALVLDLLERRHQHLVKFASCVKVTTNSDLTALHDSYSKETDDIHQFVAETETKLTASPCTAWMYRDTILTCRLGSSTSRYRGWMELIVRTPSSRQRRMVRLSSRLSIAFPERTPLSWYLMDSPAARTNKYPKLRVDNGRDSDVLAHARSVIERCDAALADLRMDNDIPPDRPGSSRFDNSPGSASDRQQSPANNEHLTTDIGSGRPFEVEHHSAAMETARIETIGNDSPMHSSTEFPTSSERSIESIHQWLVLLLDDSTNVGEVEDQLQLLGLSTSMLKNSCQSLHHHGIIPGDWPIQSLQYGPNLCRALSILDRTTTLQTHKIALLFAGHASDGKGELEIDTDTTFEDHLLGTKHGSASFLEFVSALSTVVPTRQLNYFSGGLDTSDYASDGKYAAIWIDEDAHLSGGPGTMILFHLVTLMPSGMTNRKRHIGNDNVHIIYVDQGYPLEHDIDSWYQAGDHDALQSTIVSGEFGFVTIFVVLLKETDLVRVSVRIRMGLPEATKVALRSLIGTSIVARAVAPGYVRQIAVLADLACRSTIEDRLGLASNWEERLEQIREMVRFLHASERATVPQEVERSPGATRKTLSSCV